MFYEKLHVLKSSWKLLKAKLFQACEDVPLNAFRVVYATMRNLAKQERLLECVKSLHKDTLDILQMDVTGRQSILDARDRVVEKRVDILGMLLCRRVLAQIAFEICVCVLTGSPWPLTVCNAGVGLMGPLEAQSLDSMRQIVEVNLFGTIQAIQAFLPGMKAQGRGRILVTGSTGGLQGEFERRAVEPAHVRSFPQWIPRTHRRWCLLECRKLPKQTVSPLHGLLQVSPSTRCTAPVNLL